MASARIEIRVRCDHALVYNRLNESSVERQYRLSVRVSIVSAAAHASENLADECDHSAMLTRDTSLDDSSEDAIRYTNIAHILPAHDTHTRTNGSEQRAVRLRRRMDDWAGHDPARHSPDTMILALVASVNYLSQADCEALAQTMLLHRT